MRSLLVLVIFVSLIVALLFTKTALSDSINVIYLKINSGKQTVNGIEFGRGKFDFDCSKGLGTVTKNGVLSPQSQEVCRVTGTYSALLTISAKTGYSQCSVTVAGDKQQGYFVTYGDEGCYMPKYGSCVKGDTLWVDFSQNTVCK